MRRDLVIVLGFVVGCGGHHGATLTNATLDGSGDQAVRDAVAAQVEAMADLDADGWAAVLAPDAIVLGSGAGEVWGGRDAVAAALHASFDAARGASAAATAESTALRVTVAPDGASAWMTDEQDFTVTSAGQTMKVPFRVTEVFGNTHGRWQVIVGALSVVVPPEAQGDGPPLAPIPGGVGDGGDAVYTRAAHDLDHVDDLLASVSDRADASMFTPMEDSALVGGAHVREALGAHVAAAKLALHRAGDLRVGMAPGGQLGWVLANLDATTTHDGVESSEPVRALVVYLREGADWRVVHAHVSNGT